MGAVKVAAAAPAFLLTCIHLVQLVSAAAVTGPDAYGGGAAARKLLRDDPNPDVVAYWNQKLGNLAMPEEMARLVSRLSRNDVARFQKAITSKNMLDSSQDALSATFCKLAGILSTYDNTTALAAHARDARPFEGTSWDDEPEDEASSVTRDPSRSVLLYSESELAQARHVYFLATDMPTLGASSGAKLAVVPAEIFFDTRQWSMSGAYLPRALASALAGLQSSSEFLQALRTPSASAWAATLTATLQRCVHYTGTLRAETRTCARSLEDVADFVASQLEVRPGGVAAEVSGYLKEVQDAGSLEVVKVEKRSASDRPQVLCHDLGSFAYKLQACHHLLATELYSVTLKSAVDPSVSVSNVVACHTKTDTFRPDHIAFQALGIKPGEAGVCHYTMPGVTAFYQI